MRSTLALTWFIDKGFSLAVGDCVSNPVMGEMVIRNGWDSEVAVTHHIDTTIASFAIRAFSLSERKLGMPMSLLGNMCQPDIRILLALQNMEVIYE